MKRLIYQVIVLATLFGSLGVCNQAYGQVYVERSNKVEQVGGERFYIHKVVKGQTLYSISRAYGVTEDAILSANGKRKGETIKTREELRIPMRIEDQSERIVKKESPKPNGLEIGSTIAPLSTSKAQKKAELIVVDSSNFDEIETIQGGEILGTGGDNAMGFRGGDATIAVTGNGVEGVFLVPSNGMVITDRNSRDLYNGALMAAKELQSQGVDASVSSSADAVGRASYIVATGDLFNQAVTMGMQMRVPVISPLVAVNHGSGFAIQFAPENGGKYAKLRELVGDPQNNVVLLHHNTYCDTAALFEMQAVLPLGVSVMTYSRTNKAADIAVKLDKEKVNVIVVPVNHQGSIEDILSKITSINSLKKEYQIKVIGTNRWKNLSNINPELLFKADVSYPTSYHSDRSNERMAKFYNDYISSYGELPNAFSMRGYDIVMIMSQAITDWGSNALISLPNVEFIPLQTPYRFYNGGTKIYNDDWVLVNMTPDFKIVTR